MRFADSATLGRMIDECVPSEATIFGWISEVFGQGIRRPGYPADQWAEAFCAERFREIGLDKVRMEPVAAQCWEPLEWSCEVLMADGTTRSLECFPVPFSQPDRRSRG